MTKGSGDVDLFRSLGFAGNRATGSAGLVIPWCPVPSSNGRSVMGRWITWLASARKIVANGPRPSKLLKHNGTLSIGSHRCVNTTSGAKKHLVGVSPLRRN